MPTAARLFAGLCLAMLGAAASEMIKTMLPASTDFGYFTWVNAILGFVIGWVVIGARAGRGKSAALSNGITGTVVFVFWGLFIQAGNEMVDRSFHRRYNGPVEAIGGAFELFVEYAEKLLNVNIILLFIAGAVVTGLVTEFAARRWR